MKVRFTIYNEDYSGDCLPFVEKELNAIPRIGDMVYGIDFEPIKEKIKLLKSDFRNIVFGYRDYCYAKYYDIKNNITEDESERLMDAIIADFDSCDVLCFDDARIVKEVYCCYYNNEEYYVVAIGYE